MQGIDFEFSDLVAGYVKSFDLDARRAVIVTSDGREVTAALSANVYAEIARNLGESFMDATGSMESMLSPGRFVFAYGVWYPEDNADFEMKHIVFLGRTNTHFVFESQNWWIQQIRQLGDFYINAQFGDGKIDWSDYHTHLDLYGRKMTSTRQETDTISRLIYGFASAYLLTGEDRFLEAAESGSKYLRDHFKANDATDEVSYWYHAVDFAAGRPVRRVHASGMAEVPGMRKGAGASMHERKLLASEFGDDYHAIPAYEQIYALAGPTQTYRITGDPAIRKDIDWTLNLFSRFFKDAKRGGYFSHIDPITFDPRAESLGENAARKNWNSVGDHAPAYLINLVLTTGDQRHIDMLIDACNAIVEHFPDYENSPFVQEKFHEDWSHDSVHGWQQNRGVVGHNLKIAWNLMRVNSLRNDQRYVDFATKIAELMPQHGWDVQRTGWYDVVERKLENGQHVHRFAWHDRKAWWQQEQGILAYLILNGVIGSPDYLKYARESISFYTAFFLDHDSGAVYFNTLANGLPYLLGTERQKGSHSMSGYHSFELAYLGAVYTNLLNTKQPLDMFFSPIPGGFADGILRVSPDLLPAGSVRIDEVTIDDQPYNDFDAEGLTVRLPQLDHRPRIRVRLVPTSGVEHFSSEMLVEGDTVRVALVGDLDERAVPQLRLRLDEVLAHSPASFELDLSRLTSITTPAVRAVAMAAQQMPVELDVVIRGANPAVRALLDQAELTESVRFA